MHALTIVMEKEHNTERLPDKFVTVNNDLTIQKVEYNRVTKTVPFTNTRDIKQIVCTLFEITDYEQVRMENKIQLIKEV